MTRRGLIIYLSLVLFLMAALTAAMMLYERVPKAGTIGRVTRATDPATERIVILVGLDGFRPDYLSKYKPPVLSRLAAEGVEAEKMIPSFPTLTFPNLYTLATGLYPQNHGIVGNRMRDPMRPGAQFSLGDDSVLEEFWWDGEPIWLTARRHKIKSACMFWPGSDVAIHGQRADEWNKYDGKVTPTQRVDKVLGWLARPVADRPRMITLYFHETDSAAHRHGLDSPELAASVKEVDQALGRLLAGVKEQKLEKLVHLVCVSDHGMAALSPDRVVALSTLTDMTTVEVEYTGAVAGLSPAEGAERALYEQLKAKEGGGHYQVYLRDEMPERWHYRDHRRIPPIILVAEEGWFIRTKPLLTEEESRHMLKATHGFAPELPSMSAMFIAWGPAIQRGKKLAPFDNVEVYPLLCKMLGMNPAPNNAVGKLDREVLLPPQAAAKTP